MKRLFFVFLMMLCACGLYAQNAAPVSAAKGANQGKVDLAKLAGMNQAELETYMKAFFDDEFVDIFTTMMVSNNAVLQQKAMAAAQAVINAMPAERAAKLVSILNKIPGVNFGRKSDGNYIVYTDAESFSIDALSNATKAASVISGSTSHHLSAGATK